MIRLGSKDIVEKMEHQREREHACRVSGLLEQTAAADAFQRPLRCRFQARLSAGVRCLVTCCVTGYTASMITGFKHKGLERFFLRGTKAGIQPRHAARLRLILARLHASTRPQDMHLPGLDLHELKGDRQGTWAVKVSGNWRVTFVFRGEDAESVDYEDYH